MREELTRRELLPILRKLIKDRTTGSMLIRTEDNRSIIIALKEGTIVALSHGIKRGIEAIPGIQALLKATYSLNSLVLGREQAGLPDTEQLLRMFSEVHTQQTDAVSLTASTGDRNNDFVDAVKGPLQKYLGTVAPLIADGAANEAAKGPNSMQSQTDFVTLINTLAREIPREKESQAFLRQARDLMRTFVDSRGSS